MDEGTVAVVYPGLESVWDKVAHPDQVAGTRLLRTIDGSGDGVKVLEIWNAAGLRLDVLPDRGFDIHRVEYRGVPLHWTGPPGLRPRTVYEPQAWGWLRNFHGGLLVTCGLEHVLLPTTRATPEYHFPARPVQEFGLHGRVANEAGDLLAREFVADPEPAIRVRGSVWQAALYAERLRLDRQIIVPLSSAEIRVADTVTNVGPAETHHEFLYHFNLGYPLVSEGAEVVIPTSGGGERLRVTAPKPDIGEEVPAFTPVTDANGWCGVTLDNRDRDIRLDLDYRGATFQRFFVWFMMGAGVYAIGLEPSTVGRDGDHEPLVLKPGEAASYEARVRVRGEAIPVGW